MKKFFEKTWVLFVAVAVIAASASILTASMSATQKNGVQDSPGQTADVEKVDTPVSTLSPARTSGQEEWEAPAYLLTLDESALTQPKAKDISAEVAANAAALADMQLFGADLEGEICNVAYLRGMGANLDKRWDAWQVTFGDGLAGTCVYSVTLNSVSGDVANAYKYMPLDAAESKEMDAVERRALAEEWGKQSENLAHSFLLNGMDVGSVRKGALDSFSYDNEMYYVEVYPVGGMQGVRFGFCAGMGGLVSVERMTEDMWNGEAAAEAAE